MTDIVQGARDSNHLPFLLLLLAIIALCPLCGSPSDDVVVDDDDDDLIQLVGDHCDPKFKL